MLDLRKGSDYLHRNGACLPNSSSFWERKDPIGYGHRCIDNFFGANTGYKYAMESPITMCAAPSVFSTANKVANVARSFSRVSRMKKGILVPTKKLAQTKIPSFGELTKNHPGGYKAVPKGGAARNVFPENPKDLLPRLPRDSKGYIYPADNIRIRPEKHTLKPGQTYNPRHHGLHYHIESRRNPTASWNKSSNVRKIKPEDYTIGSGMGFLPGELFPGA